jgi:hypothetical protein
VKPWRRPVAEIAIVGLAALAGLAPISPETIEDWFSKGLYPPVQRAVTATSNLLPVALLDLLSLTAVAVVVWVSIRGVRASLRTRRVGPVVSTLRSLATAAAAVYLAFLLLWGFNYRRLPMTERLLLQTEGPTAESVASLGVEATARLNALHEPAHRAGWPEAPLQDEALRRGFEAAQRALSDASLAVPGRLKPTIFGPYFRWAGVDGMINPFGLEVLANPDLLPFERPFVAAHEWSHLAGFADEAEASFVGWLTCMHGDVSTQYSGWLFLYWQVSSEVDGATRTRLAEDLDAGPRADIEAIVARLRSGELPWLRTAGWHMYDQYLKANRVEEGIRSYGAVVTLILRTRFDGGWTPLRRTTSGS